MPAHKFGLVISSAEVDVLVLLKLGIKLKVSGPILVVCVFVSLSFSDERLLAYTVSWSLVAPSEAEGAFF
jgi:hypothetical protein